MAIQTSGPISLTDVATEFGGDAPHVMSEYYGAGGVPSTGALSLGSFYGTSGVDPWSIGMRIPANAGPMGPMFYVSTPVQEGDRSVASERLYWLDVTGGPFVHTNITPQSTNGFGMRVWQAYPDAPLEIVMRSSSFFVTSTSGHQQQTANANYIGGGVISLVSFRDAAPAASFFPHQAPRDFMWDDSTAEVMQGINANYLTPDTWLAYNASIAVPAYTYNTNYKPVDTNTLIPYWNTTLYNYDMFDFDIPFFMQGQTFDGKVFDPSATISLTGTESTGAGYSQAADLIGADGIVDTYESLAHPIPFVKYGELSQEGIWSNTEAGTHDYYYYEIGAYTDSYGNVVPAAYYVVYKGWHAIGNAHIWITNSVSFTTQAERIAFMNLYPTFESLADTIVNICDNDLLPQDFGWPPNHSVIYQAADFTAPIQSVRRQSSYLDSSGVLVPATGPYALIVEESFQFYHPITGELLGGLIRESEKI